MKELIGSLIAGALAGAAAVMLHLQVAPLGLVLALVGSATTIWAVMQRTGRRRYAFTSAAAWILVAWRAALPGAGGELLVQGDLPGEVLVLLGSILVVMTASISQSK